MARKILVMGLPGTGKTALSKELASALHAVHFNADEVRKEINKDLGFTESERVEQARRMGVLCDIVKRAGHNVIADFVCPTEEAREAFNADYVIWVDRIKESRFSDTNKLFQRPKGYNIRFVGGTVEQWANFAAKILLA